MRSIIVVFAIAGLVNAQSRRLVTNFNDLSNYQDLDSTGMDLASANRFIEKVCRGYNSDANLLVKGAINIQTNDTMRWNEYTQGPGLYGDPDYKYAIYPWSVVSGRCYAVLNNTWVTDRDVVYGPWTDNTATRARIMQIGVYLLKPKSTASTTLPSWAQDIQDVSLIKNHFFSDAKQSAAKYLVNSMVWENRDRGTPINMRISIDACT
jgi:hypothetical protein